MTRELKPLTIGDTVASGSGKVFKELSAKPPIDNNTLVGTWVMNGTPTKWDGISANTYFTITGDVNCGAYTAPIGRYFCLYSSTDSMSNVNTYVKADKTSGYPAFWISKSESLGVRYKASVSSNVEILTFPVIFTITGGADTSNELLLNWFNNNTIKIS